MEKIDRRKLVFVGAAGLAAVGFDAVALGCGRKPAARDVQEEDKEKPEDVTPAEDLMREHGALNRLLLVYEEGVRRIEAPGGAVPSDALTSAAGIIRRFVEDYHEKLEEDFLFPRFESAGKLVDLVATLRKQHQAGRRLTDDIQRLASSQDPEGKQKLVIAIRSFIRMYRPHEAREDSVLFPALRSVVSPKEFEALGEQFEDKEHELFGKEGFEGIVDQVAKLEQSLGIYDLNQFTPVTT
jgi:hemerythrin-like domain-containing protein